MRGPDCDVDVPLPRRGEQGQCEQVRRDRDQRAALVRSGGERGKVADRTGGPRVGQKHAEQVAVGQALVELGDLHNDPEWLGPGREHGEGLRVRVGIDDEPVRCRLTDSSTQRHRLGRSGRLVEKRSPSRGQPGQVGDQGLEVDQRLEPALGDFGLVWGVRGVPARILQNPAQDDRRGDGVVVAETDHRREDAVAPGQLTQLRQGLVLAECGRQRQSRGGVNRGGDGGGGELLSAAVADDSEHLRLLIGRGSDVTGGEARHLDVGAGSGSHRGASWWRALRARSRYRAPPLSSGPESFEPGYRSCPVGETRRRLLSRVP
jgi:hypothetical protein